jgi:hypothetical protein
MKTISLVAVSLASLPGSSVHADDNIPDLTQLSGIDVFDHHVAAPSDAIEIGIATGYARGAGPLGGTPRLDDISNAGGALGLDAMYRIDPTFAFGVYFALARYGTNEGADVIGATAGLQAAAHFRPDRSVDPWVSVATGWRSLALPAEGSLQGFELARLELGVDYRVSEDVAIAPVVGGGLNLFVIQESPGDFMEIADKKINFVGFAGIAGRFDVGGNRR